MKYWKQIVSFILIISVVYLLFPYRSYASFTYSRSITVNTGQVPATQTSFPMLISGTYSFLATVANGGRVQNANGFDIGFYSDSNCSTGKLDWETETYSATTGTVNYWVEVPTISDGTIIYICYGDPSISTDQSNPTGVWDTNFVSVQHLPNGTTLTANDSTGVNNATNLHSSTAVAGQIDGAANFNGSTNYINVNDNNSLDLTTNGTIETWVNGTVWTATVDTEFVNKNGNYLLRKNGNGSAPGNNFSLIYWDGTNVTYLTTPNPSTGVWHHFVATISSNVIANLYLDGVLKSSGSSVFFAGARDLTQGLSYAGNTTGGELLTGKLDEIRISKSVRSGNWITTEYNNQFAPATFYRVGAETTFIFSHPKVIVMGNVVVMGKMIIN